MQRWHEVHNIPIEILRSFVVIQETGSFTKAASLMKLTQPAISGQIKRLQQLVGGEVFVKSGFGVALTERGEVVNRYARRILALNDQIVSMSGSKFQSKLLRVGVPSLLGSVMLPAMINACKSVLDGYQLQFSCDLSAELSRRLASGYLDIACYFSPSIPHEAAIVRWEEGQSWVCSPDLVLAPGATIPLSIWRGGFAQHFAVRAIEAAGLQYSVAFVASDLASLIASLREGLGYSMLPDRLVPPDLKIARERFLPAVPPFGVGIYLRDGIDSEKALEIASKLGEVLRPSGQYSLQYAPKADFPGCEPQIQALRSA